MVVRISQAIVVLSGALTGLAAIAALSYYRRSNNTLTRPDTATTPETTRGTSRLRRSRHVRIRRNRPTTADLETEPTTTAATAAAISETEEDLGNGRMLSFIKEWSEDDNKNLLNLLHAISLNQSRKG